MDTAVIGKFMLNYVHESCICVCYLYHVPSGMAASVSQHAVCGGIRYLLSVSADDVLYVNGGLNVSGVRYKRMFSVSCGKICYTFMWRVFIRSKTC